MEIPEELDTPEFREAWEAYCQLRKAKRWGQWIPQTVAIRFSQFVDWGVEKSTIALRKSVENEWRGVFEPKPSELPQQKSTLDVSARQRFLERHRDDS